MCTKVLSRPGIWSSEKLTSEKETKLVVREGTRTDTTRFLVNLKKRKERKRKEHCLEKEKERGGHRRGSPVFGKRCREPGAFAVGKRYELFLLIQLVWTEETLGTITLSCSKKDVRRLTGLGKIKSDDVV